MGKKKQYSSEERAEYRRHKALLAYDRATTARDIIREAYRRAHPRSHKDPRDGICSCGSPIQHAPIAVYLDDRGHEYHNHKSCRSWACPICAPKRAASRADEIEAALLSANAKGYTCLFLTFTVPHRKAHSSAFVIDRLNKCYNKFLQHRRLRAIKDKYGYIGAIKCLDYTLTDNGTHAHLHAIFFFDTDLDAFDLAARIGADFVDLWDRVVFIEAGQHISKRHGFNVELIELGSPDDPDVSRVAKYSAKAISVYCSDGDKDKGSRHPFDLLNSGATGQDRALFLDFYKGQKGRRHIRFSRGLRDALDMDDMEQKKRKDAAVVANIEYEHAHYLEDEARRLEFERRLNENIVAALAWLNDEAERQQRDYAARYRDHDRRNLKLRPVLYEDVAAALDAEGVDTAAVIAAISEEQVDFLPSIHREEERAEAERIDRAIERISARRASLSKSRRRPVSGLGAALALADERAPRPARDSLFYPSEGAPAGRASIPAPAPYAPPPSSALAASWDDGLDFGF